MVDMLLLHLSLALAPLITFLPSATCLIAQAKPLPPYLLPTGGTGSNRTVSAPFSCALSDFPTNITTALAIPFSSNSQSLAAPSSITPRSLQSFMDFDSTGNSLLQIISIVENLHELENMILCRQQRQRQGTRNPQLIPGGGPFTGFSETWITAPSPWRGQGGGAALIRFRFLPVTQPSTPSTGAQRGRARQAAQQYQQLTNQEAGDVLRWIRSKVDGYRDHWEFVPNIVFGVWTQDRRVRLGKGEITFVY